MKTSIALCMSILFVAVSLPAFADNANTESSRRFEKTVPAAGLNRLKLHNAVGEVHIKAADTDSVKIKVTAKPGSHAHFIFDWTTGSEPAGELPEGLHLVAAQADGTLVPRLVAAPSAGTASSSGASNSVAIGLFGTTRVNGLEHNWKADWTIVVPARLAVKLKVNVGSAKIHGIAGGLTAKINIGSLKTKLPRGPIHAKVNIGKIEADVGSAGYDRVNLSANVGDTVFRINGRNVNTGKNQQLHGHGEADYTLKTNIGSVELNLGVDALAAPPTHAIPAPATLSAPAASSHAPRPVTTPAPQTASASATVHAY